MHLGADERHHCMHSGVDPPSSGGFFYIRGWIHPPAGAFFYIRGWIHPIARGLSLITTCTRPEIQKKVGVGGTFWSTFATRPAPLPGLRDA